MEIRWFREIFFIRWLRQSFRIVFARLRCSVCCPRIAIHSGDSICEAFIPWSLDPITIIVNENKQQHEEKIRSYLISLVRIRFCLFRPFFPFASSLALRESAIIFLLKRMTIHTHTHRYIHRKLDFRFYCRDALLFDQFHHSRLNTIDTELEAAGNRHSVSIRRDIADVHVHPFDYICAFISGEKL